MDSELVALIRRRSRRIRPRGTDTATGGRLPRTPKAVLFDVYGTLLVRRGGDPGPVSRSGSRTLETRLEEAISAVHARMRRRGIRHPEVDIQEIWKGLFPGRRPSDLRRRIVQYELSRHPCWPMPGARRLIAGLGGLGLALGIVSNAQFYTPLFLEALLGGPLEQIGFHRELCFFSWRRRRAKPGPELFEQAAGALAARGISRGEILVVGNDPVNDVQPGAAAGFMTARLVADGRSLADASPAARDIRPDVSLGRLADLLAIISPHGRKHQKNSTRSSSRG